MLDTTRARSPGFNERAGYFYVDLLDGYDNLDARLSYYLGELANALFWF